MADISEINLKMAREFGCEHVVNSAEQDLEQVIMELTDGVGVDMVFLGFGDAPTIEQACRIVRRGGVVHQHALMLDGIGFPIGYISSTSSPSSLIICISTRSSR